MVAPSLRIAPDLYIGDFAAIMLSVASPDTNTVAAQNAIVRVDKQDFLNFNMLSNATLIRNETDTTITLGTGVGQFWTESNQIIFNVGVVNPGESLTIMYVLPVTEFVPSAEVLSRITGLEVTQAV